MTRPRPRLASMITAVLLPLSVAACDTVASDEINTRGIYAELTATDDGTGTTTVFAYLRVGSATSLDFLELVGGDTLVARLGDVALTMTPSEPLPDLLGYIASFDAPGGGQTVEIDLLRPSEQSALGARVTMPPGFEPSAPIEGATVSRAAELRVAWSPSPGSSASARVQVEGGCFDVTPIELAEDRGEIVLTPASWIVEVGHEAEACEGTLTIERILVGTVPSDYKGGRFLGIQRRTLTINVTP